MILEELSLIRSPIIRRVSAFMLLTRTAATDKPLTPTAFPSRLSTFALAIREFRVSISLSFAFISAITAAERAGSSSTLPDFRFSAMLPSSASLWSSRAITPEPVTPSILRTPEATDDSETMRNNPIWEVFFTWVPPQNSTDLSSTLTTRTTSPYFSPNSAIAPSFLASSRAISWTVTS